jgi:hypothetical protein
LCQFVWPQIPTIEVKKKERKVSQELQEKIAIAFAFAIAETFKKVK